MDKLPQGPPETLNVRGDIYQALNRPAEAEADYRRLIELRPKGPDADLVLAEAYVGLARLQEKQGRPGKATEHLDRLVQEAPESAWAYLRRAEHRRDRGEYDGAWALAAWVGATKEPETRPAPAVFNALQDASKQLSAERKTARDRILEDVALQRMPSATARAGLDTLAWADAALYHAWRLAESLGIASGK